MRPKIARDPHLAACGGNPPSDEYVAPSAAVVVAPPELPVYEQPPCPGDGYLWTPGYWAWGGAAFVFHEGYWGEHVGFYGGVVYGFGYFGHGYEGGHWDCGHFFYNRSVTNVNVTVVHNVYNTTIVNNNVTRVSYNGGNGGLTERATSEEEVEARERHVGPVAAQSEQARFARGNPQLRRRPIRGGLRSPRRREP